MIARASAAAGATPCAQPRVASLCTGYGGLDLAVAAVFGARPAFVADPDPDAARVLAHRFPQVPNLGDITATDLAAAPHAQILAAGFPCQDISLAGRGAGIHGSRSALFDTVADAVRDLRPLLVILENVSGLRTRGMQHVQDRLAGCGLDTVWLRLRASDVGAPHQRARYFILGYRDDALPLLRAAAAAHPESQRRNPRTDRPGAAPGSRPRGRPDGRGQHPADPILQARTGGSAAHPAGLGRCTRIAEPTRLRRGPDAHLGDRPPGPPPRSADRSVGAGGGTAETHSTFPWGRYTAAIRRWEHATGHQAPDPTEPGRGGRPRLNPAFVDWAMGHPGWVTAVPGLTRRAQLRLLGNGCVPQQAEAALRLLVHRAVAIIQSAGGEPSFSDGIEVQG